MKTIQKTVFLISLGLLALSLSACNYPVQSGSAQSATSTPIAVSDATLTPEPTETTAPSPTQAVVSTLMCEPTAMTTTGDWSLCRSLLYGFDLQFPAAGQLKDQRADYARIDLPFTPGTNLTEKYLEIEFTDTIGDCTSPLAAGRPASSVMQEKVTLNGNTFFKQSGDGVAAGNIYTWEAYSIAQANRCISLDFVLHSFHPELAPTPPPEYDQAAESAVFQQMVETFTWLGTAQYTGGDIAPTATPDMGVQPTPTPTRIQFAPGAVSGQVSGKLSPSGMDAYVLRASKGQTLQVDLSFTQGQAILIIWGEDGTVLISDHAGAASFNGQIPLTQDYYIHVRGTPDSATAYQMTVRIPEAAAQPTPTPTRITFAPGAVSGQVSGHLSPSGMDAYVLRAMKGQTIKVNLSFTQGEAILIIWGKDGTVLISDHAGATTFTGTLPLTEDYFIHVRGNPDTATDYQMTVTIE